MLQLALRGAEFLFTLLIMALVGNMIASAVAGNPSLINYDMFVAVFGMLTLFYLIAICFREQFTIHKFVPASLDLLNVLFYFCAAVAMSAELGAHSCSNSDYTESNHITNGSNDTAGRCREAQATTAFLWFAWACFVVSLFLTLTASGGVNMRGPRRGPNMSQV
ncbi:hypothetical protein H2198_005544 [Neophaeococcomyces mojaviensis]|uniref:Uncharacterized protein n=1 Tax=Neophaeococcomyces mojaviensis TaxID=3383035 RepID=A0ACC3A5G9_9EURO|nr:hypothetical protein H2198_005544 [Knufia sp. JES_112]